MKRMKQKSWPVKTTLVLATALFLSLAAVAANDAKPNDSAAARNPTPAFGDEDSSSALNSPFRAVDLSLGETASVKLADGRSVEVKLLDLRETRDRLRHAVRQAQVTVEINGQKLVLPSAGYHLPTAVGGVQVDCPITKGLVQRGSNPWALDKDARLRLWPAGAPWIQPGTFRYPLRQWWFASDTQMANEPTFVNGDEAPGKTNVYYHWGLDAGGRSDCDFAVVQVMDPTQPRQLQPTIHACYWPTENLKPGDEVTFKVRTFQVRPTEGRERWDFGDGSPPVEVQSDGNAKTLAKDGYAITTHRYAHPGRYHVSVQRTNDRGESATGRLQVVVEEK